MIERLIRNCIRATFQVAGGVVVWFPLFLFGSHIGVFEVFHFGSPDWQQCFGLAVLMAAAGVDNEQ